MKEEWKPIEDYPYYEISNKGRVRYKTQYLRVHKINKDTKVVYIASNGESLTLFIEELLHKYFNKPYKPITTKGVFRKRRKKRKCCGK